MNPNPTPDYANSPILDDRNSSLLPENTEKNYIIALVLSYFLGTMGVDRFYLGKIGSGVLKLLTFGGFGVWGLVDFLRIAFGKITAKDSPAPLEGYAKYSKSMKMVATIVFIVNVLFLLFYVGTLAATGKNRLTALKDNRTYYDAQVASSALNEHIVIYHEIPADLQNIASPSSLVNITYTKDSNTAYTFCARYDHAGKIRPDNPDAKEITSTEALYIPSEHKAGQNCQTITPPSYYLDPLTGVPGSSTAAAAIDQVEKGCGVRDIIGTAQTNTVTKTLTGNKANGVAEYILTQPSRGGGLIWKITDSTPVYDATCTLMDHSKVYSNDSVSIFTKPRPGLTIVGEPQDASVIIDHTKH